MRTNEIFLLVGEVIAQIVAAASPSHPPPDVTTAAADLVSARAPFVDFVQEPWWDVAVPREGSSVDGGVCGRAASLPETLRGLCEESSALLRSAFGTLPQALLGEVTAERFGRVVGMFEQNNVGVRVSSAVPSLLGGVMAGPELNGASLDELVGLVGQIEEFQEDGYACCSGDEGGEEAGGETVAVEREEGRKATCQKAAATERPGDMGETVAVEREEGRIATLQKAAAAERPDDMFAPLDGTALYSLVCCMNHSCRPNCVVRYPRGASDSADGKASPLVAHVVLLEQVAAGDELTQSYVDKDMGLLERRKALEDYGFLCRCPRCLEEDAST